MEAKITVPNKLAMKAGAEFESELVSSENENPVVPVVSTKMIPVVVSTNS